jgi:hypothetical protein
MKTLLLAALSLSVIVDTGPSHLMQPIFAPVRHIVANPRETILLVHSRAASAVPADHVYFQFAVVPESTPNPGPSAIYNDSANVSIPKGAISLTTDGLGEAVYALTSAGIPKKDIAATLLQRPKGNGTLQVGRILVEVVPATETRYSELVDTIREVNLTHGLRKTNILVRQNDCSETASVRVRARAAGFSEARVLATATGLRLLALKSFIGIPPPVQFAQPQYVCGAQHIPDFPQLMAPNDPNALPRYVTTIDGASIYRVSGVLGPRMTESVGALAFSIMPDDEFGQNLNRFTVEVPSPTRFITTDATFRLAVRPDAVLLVIHSYEKGGLEKVIGALPNAGLSARDVLRQGDRLFVQMPLNEVARASMVSVLATIPGTYHDFVDFVANCHRYESYAALGAVNEGLPRGSVVALAQRSDLDRLISIEDEHEYHEATCGIGPGSNLSQLVRATNAIPGFSTPGWRSALGSNAVEFARTLRLTWSLNPNRVVRPRPNRAHSEIFGHGEATIPDAPSLKACQGSYLKALEGASRDVYLKSANDEPRGILEYLEHWDLPNGCQLRLQAGYVLPSGQMVRTELRAIH